MPGLKHSGKNDARAREYGQVAVTPHHTIWCEVIIEGTMLAAGVMFILGSLCFFEGLPFQVLEVGEILFIVASFIYVGIGLLEMWEMCNTQQPDDEEEDVIIAACESAFHEQMAYLISAIVFAAGTVLYWPGIYRNNKDAAAIGGTVASWCFILGSLGFVVASFWNAVQLAEHPEGMDNPTWRRLTKMALFFSIMGGVLFVTGSYLFSLNVEGGCESNTDTGTKGKDANVEGKWCVGVTDQGTVLFVIGSIFYTIQSTLNCVKLCLRRFVKINRHGYCEVGMQDDDDELDSRSPGGSSSLLSTERLE